MALTISPARSSTVNGANGIRFTFTFTSAPESWQLANTSYTSESNTLYYNQWTQNGTVSNGGKTWTVIAPASMLVSGKNNFTIYYPYYDSYGDYQWMHEDFYLTVQFASLTAPTSLAISQDSYSRQLKASWNAATASGGSGSVTYELIDIGDGTKVWPTSGTSTSRSCTFTPLVVGTSREYGIQASYSGLSAMGKRASFTHKKPQLQTWPVVTVTKAKDVQLAIKWTDGEYYYASGATVQFQVYIGTNTTFSNSKLAATVTGATMASNSTHLAKTEFNTTITEAKLQSLGFNYGQTLYVAVRPYTTASADTTLVKTIPAANYKSFTFARQGTVKYCYDGSHFVECEVYYCIDGQHFTRCQVSYCYDGEHFMECSF